MDILNEISKYVDTNPTPIKFMRFIEHIFKDLDGEEEFIRKNIEDADTKKVLLRYNQTMRESAVLSAEIFQEYVDKLNKEQE